MHKNEDVLSQLLSNHLVSVIHAIGVLNEAAKRGETWTVETLEEAIKSLAENENIQFFDIRSQLDIDAYGAVSILGEMIAYNLLLDNVAYTQKMIACSKHISHEWEYYIRSNPEKDKTRITLGILQAHMDITNILLGKDISWTKEEQKNLKKRQSKSNEKSVIKEKMSALFTSIKTWFIGIKEKGKTAIGTLVEKGNGQQNVIGWIKKWIKFVIIHIKSALIFLITDKVYKKKMAEGAKNSGKFVIRAIKTTFDFLMGKGEDGRKIDIRIKTWIAAVSRNIQLGIKTVAIKERRQSAARSISDGLHSVSKKLSSLKIAQKEKRNQKDSFIKSVMNGFKKLFGWLFADTLNQKDNNEIENKKDVDKKAFITFVRRYRRVFISGGALVMCLLILGLFVVLPSIRYNKAKNYFIEKNFAEAHVLFEKLDDYKDSELYNIKSKYAYGLELVDNEAYEEAQTMFVVTGNYLSSEKNYDYCEANILMQQNDFVEAAKIFEELYRFNDSIDKKEDCRLVIDYYRGQEAYKNQCFTMASKIFEGLGCFMDSEAMAEKSGTLKSIHTLNQYITETSFISYESDHGNQINSIFQNNTASEMDEWVETLYYKHNYNAMLACIYQGSGVAVIDDANAYIANLPEHYEDVHRYTQMLSALNSKDYGTYFQYVTEFAQDKSSFNEKVYGNNGAGLMLGKLVKLPFASIGRITSAQKLDEALSAFASTQNYYENKGIASASYASLSVDSLSRLTAFCGNEADNKILILKGRSIQFNDMNGLRSEYIPKAADEVKYILTTRSREISVGWYTSGTKAVRELEEVVLISCPSGGIAKTFGRVYGSYPPSSFTYYGYPPSEKSGGSPDSSKVEAIFEKAIARYAKDEEVLNVGMEEPIAEDDETYGDYAYTVNDGEVMIKAYNGDDIEVVIPDTIDNMPVTAMSYDVFLNHTDIQKVTLPKELKTVPSRIFANNTNLVEIKIPNGVTEIGDSAFSGCTALNTIEIPESVKRIESGAFFGCTGLTEIVFSHHMEYIGPSAFRDCTALTEINFDAGVAEIALCAFENTAIRKIELPEGTKYLGYGVFQFCTQLRKVVLPDSLVVIGENNFEQADIKVTASDISQYFYMFIESLDNENWDMATVEKMDIIPGEISIPKDIDFGPILSEYKAHRDEESAEQLEDEAVGD